MTYFENFSLKVQLSFECLLIVFLLTNSFFSSAGAQGRRSGGDRQHSYSSHCGHCVFGRSTVWRQQKRKQEHRVIEVTGQVFSGLINRSSAKFNSSRLISKNCQMYSQLALTTENIKTLAPPVPHSLFGLKNNAKLVGLGSRHWFIFADLNVSVDSKYKHNTDKGAKMNYI